MGHKKIETTMNIYGHLINEDLEQAVELLLPASFKTRTMAS
jgi:hypothetical protein